MKSKARRLQQLSALYQEQNPQAPGTSVGALLSDGVRELVDAFKQKGQGDVADSWVSRGPNKPISPSQLEQAIGSNVLRTYPGRPAYREKRFFRGYPTTFPKL
jgi:uncharacterized protein YidB (DUF937 family)